MLRRHLYSFVRIYISLVPQNHILGQSALNSSVAPVRQPLVEATSANAKSDATTPIKRTAPGFALTPAKVPFPGNDSHF